MKLKSFAASALACCTAANASSCPENTTSYEVSMHDSYGDGWSGNYIHINNCTGGSLDPAHLPMTLEDGSISEDKFVCLPTGDFQYDIYVGGGTYTYEISWEIYEPGCSELDGAACATTWHEDDSEGEDYAYNTCPTPAPTVCSGEKYTVSLSDSYGDGWGDSSLRLYDCLGNLLKADITLPEGSSATQEICLPSGTTQFQAECGGSAYWEAEISWSIADKAGAMVLSGGAPMTIADGTAPSLCETCEAAGGANITVYVQYAHIQDGGEWWDSKADAFAVVGFDADQGDILLTSVIDDNNHPHWNEYLYFGCVFPGLPMTVEVYDFDFAGGNDLLVYNEWADWEAWPEGAIKRLNDTQASNSDSYHKEYFVEVAYYKGAVPVARPTPAPSSHPTPRPVPRPTSTPGTPTHAPTHTSDPTTDDFIKRHDDDGDDSASAASSGGTSAVLGVVLGLLALAAVCAGAGVWASKQARQRGHESAWAWASASVVDPYSPMGSASMERAPSGLTLDALRKQHANRAEERNPMHPSGGLGGADGGISLDAGRGGGGSGGYMPPVLAVPTDDDEEEEVAIGGVGKYSASV